MARGDARFHSFQLTANNPVEHGFTHDWLKLQLSSFGSLDYYCMADERGKEGTYHTHVYFHVCNNAALSTVIKRFPGVHVEAVRGKPFENRAYIRKEGKYGRDENGNYSYTDSSGLLHEGINYADTFEEEGNLPDVGISSRGSQSSKILEMVEAGYTNDEIVRVVPSLFREIDKIDRVRSLFRDSKFSNVWRDLHVSYLFGPTGCGKSRSVMEEFGYSACYRVTDYSHPFDAYDGEDVLVFEEFRGGLKHGDMLNYLDGYPLLLPCRYFNRRACFTKVFIVSNLSPDRIYPNIDVESRNAFYRRIHLVREFYGCNLYREYPGVFSWLSRHDWLPEENEQINVGETWRF